MQLLPQKRVIQGPTYQMYGLECNENIGYPFFSQKKSRSSLRREHGNKHINSPNNRYTKNHLNQKTRSFRDKEISEHAGRPVYLFTSFTQQKQGN